MSAVSKAITEAAEQERAAIVGWLRGEAEIAANIASHEDDVGNSFASDWANSQACALMEAANAIQRGDHHPKGGIDG